MKCLSVFAMIACGCSMVVIAENDSRRGTAEELVNVMDIRQTVAQTFELAKQSLPMQMGNIQELSGGKDSSSTGSPFTQSLDILAKEMSWDKVKDEYVDLYEKTFTEKEMKDIILFCKSPSGQAFVKKQPELMKGSMEIKQKKLQGVMSKIQELIEQNGSRSKK